jgi:hypothetical protein
MSDIPLPSTSDERPAIELLAQYDAPAYVRRARAMEQALESLLDRCGRKREQWLELVRLRVGALRAMAGNWENLRMVLADDTQLALLQKLHETLAPKLRVPIAPTSSPRQLSQALVNVQQSIGRFNQRWVNYLAGVDLSEVNEHRLKYNRYYLLEKECALRSAAAARRGFVRLPPLRMQDLTELLPPLAYPLGR